MGLDGRLASPDPIKAHSSIDDKSMPRALAVIVGVAFCTGREIIKITVY